MKSLALVLLFLFLYIFDLIIFDPTRELNPFVNKTTKYICLVLILANLVTIRFAYREKLNLTLYFLVLIYGFAFVWNVIVRFI